MNIDVVTPRLIKFDQFSDGATAFEADHGHVSRNRGYAFMQGEAGGSGDAALQPVKIILQHRADQPHTATPLDAQATTRHPDCGQPAALANMAHGRLLLACREVAPEFGGYLEGALSAAEVAFHQLGK